VVELADQVPGVLVQDLVVDAGFRDVEVEDRCDQVEKADEQQSAISLIVSMPVSISGKSKLSSALRDRGLDQRAADDDAENDGADGQPLDPAVGDDQQAVRQVFGEDAVLGRRVGGGAEADHGVGDQRVDGEEHHRAADDLDRVADEHDPPLGHRIGKGADEGGEGDVGDGEEGLQQRLVRAGACISRSAAMATISSALSASAEKNCAAMMM
jgi:hypothetical protein